MCASFENRSRRSGLVPSQNLFISLHFSAFPAQDSCAGQYLISGRNYKRDTLGLLWHLPTYMVNVL